eukprot:tig00021339_g20391.t1
MTPAASNFFTWVKAFVPEHARPSEITMVQDIPRAPFKAVELLACISKIGATTLALKRPNGSGPVPVEIGSHVSTRTRADLSVALSRLARLSCSSAELGGVLKAAGKANVQAPLPNLRTLELTAEGEEDWLPGTPLPSVDDLTVLIANASSHPPPWEIDMPGVGAAFPNIQRFTVRRYPEDPSRSFRMSEASAGSLGGLMSILGVPGEQQADDPSTLGACFYCIPHNEAGPREVTFTANTCSTEVVRCILRSAKKWESLEKLIIISGNLKRREGPISFPLESFSLPSALRTLEMHIPVMNMADTAAGMSHEEGVASTLASLTGMLLLNLGMEMATISVYGHEGDGLIQPFVSASVHPRCSALYFFSVAGCVC